MIDNAVDEPIGAADALDQGAVAGGVAVVDVDQPAEVLHRPGQGAHEGFEGRFVPGQGVVEGAGAFAGGAQVGGQSGIGGQPGGLLALVAQLAVGGRVSLRN